MKHFFIIIIFFMCRNSIFAHEPNEAFFTFNLKDSLITVTAELPWSMRNALINYNPKLEKSTNRQDFENTFFEYVKHNLILKDTNGMKFEFQKLKELKNNGHSHQNNYLLTFKGNNLAEITNTIMFNTYIKQVNHNTITWIGTKFKTSNNNNSFKVNEENKLRFFNKWCLFLILTLLIFLTIIIKKITTNNGYN